MVSKLSGRRLLVLSARDLVLAAEREKTLLVAFVAPAPAALAGFARAARDARAPFVVARPSGATEEPGPEEAREDAAFVAAALQAADELHLAVPIALLKEPPRDGGRAAERIAREIEQGFTGVALSTGKGAKALRDAALALAPACDKELGVEIVPADDADGVELVRQLRSRGAGPSTLRITGREAGAAALAGELGGTVPSSSAEQLAGNLAGLGVHQLLAAGPFLRALQRALPAATFERLSSWAAERGLPLEQSAARHQKLLRELPAAEQERLEALCCFEALDLYRKAGAGGTAPRLAGSIASGA